MTRKRAMPYLEPLPLLPQVGFSRLNWLSPEEVAYLRREIERAGRYVDTLRAPPRYVVRAGDVVRDGKGVKRIVLGGAGEWQVLFYWGIGGIWWQQKDSFVADTIAWLSTLATAARHDSMEPIIAPLARFLFWDVATAALGGTGGLGVVLKLIGPATRVGEAVFSHRHEIKLVFAINDVLKILTLQIRNDAPTIAALVDDIASFVGWEVMDSDPAFTGVDASSIAGGAGAAIGNLISAAPSLGGAAVGAAVSAFARFLLAAFGARLRNLADPRFRNQLWAAIRARYGSDEAKRIESVALREAIEHRETITRAVLASAATLASAAASHPKLKKLAAPFIADIRRVANEVFTNLGRRVVGAPAHP